MRLIVAVVVMIFSFSVVSGTAILIARQQPVPEALAVLHFDICEPPCWNNITPGVTTLDEALKQINTLYPAPDYEITTESSYPDNVSKVTEVKIFKNNKSVATIHLFRMNNQIVNSVTINLSAYSGKFIHYSDIHRLFGMPTHIHLPDFSFISATMLYFYKTGNILVSVYTESDSESRILAQPVHYVAFSAPDDYVFRFGTTKWQGFYPVEKYLQLICNEQGCD